MIANIRTNEKLSSVVTELFLSGRKLTISFLSILQKCFKVTKNVTLNTNPLFYHQNSKQIIT